MNAYLLGMKNYATFVGRATRAQYWQFVLVVIAMLLIAFVLDAIMGGNAAREGGMLAAVVTLVHLLPSIAFSVRRLHDTDRSGWWYLLSLVPLANIAVIVLTCMPSSPGTNRYGPPVGQGGGAHTGGQWSLDSYRGVDPADLHAPSVTSQRFSGLGVPPAHSAAASKSNGLSSEQNALIEQLERLASLRTAGVLDETEFAALKAKLLPPTS